ncbi:MAG TPA: ribonuclease HI family protein [Candidatus Babeliales bacterium]|nr:ribonuclease HI family protein [Candidatus Babeliales bacterium]
MKQLLLFDSENNTVSSGERSYWKMFIDGASRDNPGKSGAGVYIVKNDKVVGKFGYYLGIKTNNQAEYLALVLGLFYLKNNVAVTDFVMIFSDSQLLVRQIQGIYKIKNELLKPLYAVAKKILSSMKYDIAHIMREENSNADALANKGIHEKILLTEDQLAFLRDHNVSID